VTVSFGGVCTLLEDLLVLIYALYIVAVDVIWFCG